MPAGLRHRQVYVDGSSVHVVEAGDPAAAPVVFLHGWPESWRSWLPVMERAGEQVRAIAMDLPGVGESTGAATDGSKRELARVVHSVIGALDLDDVTLVGHDVGGMVAYSYLRAHRIHEHSETAGGERVERTDEQAATGGQRALDGGIGAVDPDVGGPRRHGRSSHVRKRADPGDIAAIDPRDEVLVRHIAGRRTRPVELPPEQRPVEVHRRPRIWLQGLHPARNALLVSLALAHLVSSRSTSRYLTFERTHTQTWIARDRRRPPCHRLRAGRACHGSRVGGGAHQP